MAYLVKVLSKLAICKCQLAHLSAVQGNKSHSDWCSDKRKVMGLSQRCLRDWDPEG